jgi:signal-transduction protein with cAMP-binding, CBS, and nucleotidyltransferase domain
LAVCSQFNLTLLLNSLVVEPSAPALGITRNRDLVTLIIADYSKSTVIFITKPVSSAEKTYYLVTGFVQ